MTGEMAGLPLARIEKLRVAGYAAPTLRDARRARPVKVVDASGQVLRTIDSRELAEKVLRRADIEFDVVPDPSRCTACGAPKSKSATQRRRGREPQAGPCARCRSLAPEVAKTSGVHVKLVRRVLRGQGVGPERYAVVSEALLAIGIEAPPPITHKRRSCAKCGGPVRCSKGSRSPARCLACHPVKARHDGSPCSSCHEPIVGFPRKGRCQKCYWAWSRSESPCKDCGIVAKLSHSRLCVPCGQARYDRAVASSRRMPAGNS